MYSNVIKKLLQNVKHSEKTYQLGLM